MNRRDWLKCLLAAPAAGAAVALAKSEPKPEFPRYFVTVQPPRLFPLVAYVEWRRPGSVFFITPDGVEMPSCWPDFDICVNEALHSGRWREITAAEAEALLKPKSCSKECDERFFAVLQQRRREEMMRLADSHWDLNRPKVKPTAFPVSKMRKALEDCKFKAPHNLSKVARDWATKRVRAEGV